MSLVIGTLGKLLFIATAGAGAVYAISSSSSSKITDSNNNSASVSPSPNVIEEVKLENEQDYKKFCLIVLQGGEKGQSEKIDKKLLVCRVKGNPVASEFYFYDSSVVSSKSLKEVKSLKATQDTGEVKLTFYKNLENSSEKEETISVSNGLWSFLNGVEELKKETTINWQDNEQQERLLYGGTYRQLIKWEEDREE